jgi:methylphosphotriester-DNA--protein-cysteine methyltransferase
MNDLRENYDELREFVRLICLQLQKHDLSDGQKNELFQYSYRMYVKHRVEDATFEPDASEARLMEERTLHRQALQMQDYMEAEINALEARNAELMEALADTAEALEMAMMAAGSQEAKACVKAARALLERQGV